MARVVCIGGAAVDLKYKLGHAAELGTSNPAVAATAHGGVARNVAESLARLSIPTALISIVGRDADGDALLAHLSKLGVDLSGVERATDRRTASYAAILAPDGALTIGASDLAILEALSPDLLRRHESRIAAAAWVFADCNLPPATLAGLLALRRQSAFRLAIDAVSRAKAQRVPRDLAGVDLLFLNDDEARALLGDAACDPAARALALHRRGASHVALTLGAAGLVLAQAGAVRHRPARAVDGVDATGAGDALVAGTLSRLVHGAGLEAALDEGMLLAALTIGSNASVHPQLSPALLAEARRHRAPCDADGGCS
jgi:pseudouridine kinase